jgi:hypothetical protein
MTPVFDWLDELWESGNVTQEAFEQLRGELTPLLLAILDNGDREAAVLVATEYLRDVDPNALRPRPRGLR